MKELYIFYNIHEDKFLAAGTKQTRPSGPFGSSREKSVLLLSDHVIYWPRDMDGLTDCHTMYKDTPEELVDWLVYWLGQGNSSVLTDKIDHYTIVPLIINDNDEIDYVDFFRDRRFSEIAACMDEWDETNLFRVQ